MNNEFKQTKNTLLLAVVLALIGFGLYQCKKPDPKVADPTPTESPNGGPNYYAPLDAIKYAALNLRDVNNDGLYNCIDYAVLFHEAFPRSRIIRNENLETGWHHLFNAIPNGRGLLYIEPNSYGKYYFNMTIVWGDAYNPGYNKDETLFWEKYCRW